MSKFIFDIIPPRHHHKVRHFVHHKAKPFWQKNSGRIKLGACRSHSSTVLRSDFNGYPTKKSILADRFLSVDPARLALASSGANADMLLHTPQAQIHGSYYKSKKALLQGLFCSTRL